jgi:stage V sporulation protein SpoVS
VRCVADILEPPVAPQPRPAAFRPLAPPEAPERPPQQRPPLRALRPPPAADPGLPGGGGGGASGWGSRRLLEHSYAQESVPEAAPVQGGRDGRDATSSSSNDSSTGQDAAASRPAETAGGPPQHNGRHVGPATAHEENQQPELQQQQRQHRKNARQGQGSHPPLHQMAACSRKAISQCARTAQRHARRGMLVRLPAASDGQAVAALKALTQARTMALAHGAPGLAFQLAAVRPGPRGGAGGASTTSSSDDSSGAGGRDSSSKGGATGGLAFFAACVDELCLLRFDPAPLIASRHAGSGPKLGAALAARIAERGHATLHAAGPDAARTALAALAAARDALLRRGCDFAVLPARHAAPARARGDADGAGSWQDDEADDPRLVHALALHVVRCAPRGGAVAGWELQPWGLGAPARAPAVARAVVAAPAPAPAPASDRPAAPQPVTAPAPQAPVAAATATAAPSKPAARDEGAPAALPCRDPQGEAAVVAPTPKAQAARPRAPPSQPQPPPGPQLHVPQHASLLPGAA